MAVKTAPTHAAPAPAARSTGGKTGDRQALIDALNHDLAGEYQAILMYIHYSAKLSGPYRNELRSFFPHDEDAKRLSQQSFLLSEFLERERYQPPKLRRKALVHGHCHHRAVMTMAAEEAVLAKLGLDRKVLLVDHQENPNLWLAARNLSDVQLIPNLQVTPYHVLNANHVVFTKAAIEALQEALAK